MLEHALPGLLALSSHCEVTTVGLRGCNRDCRASQGGKVYYTDFPHRAFGAELLQSRFGTTMQKSGATPITWAALRCRSD